MRAYGEQLLPPLTVMRKPIHGCQPKDQVENLHLHIHLAGIEWHALFCFQNGIRKNPIKIEGLKYEVSQHDMNMYRFQLKITYQSKHWEDLKLNEKLIDAKTEMIEMLELSDKDFEAAMIKMLQQKIVSMLETNKNRKS